jgi:hypothetical protein
MPDFVIAAIEAAQPPDTADVDQDIVEKVAQPFMDMFKQVVWTPKANGNVAGTPGDVAPFGRTGIRPITRRRKRKTGSAAPSGSVGGSEAGTTREVRAAIPECVFDEGAFCEEERKADIRVGVKYIPGPSGRLGKVVIDPRFPLIEDRTQYWLDRTAPPQHEEARTAVRVVYATAMACRVGQILALGRSAGLTLSTLTDGLMSNEALTCSLFGLASEHTVIKGRLSGRVRKAA